MLTFLFRSISTLLSSYRISSNECDAIISQCHVSTLDRFVFRQFSLDVQKAFVRQCIQILLLYGYSYFIAVYPNVVLANGLYMSQS